MIKVGKSASGPFLLGFGDDGERRRRTLQHLPRVAPIPVRVADGLEMLRQSPPAAVVRARLLPRLPSEEYLRLRLGIIPSGSDGKSRRKGPQVLRGDAMPSCAPAAFLWLSRLILYLPGIESLTVAI